LTSNSFYELLKRMILLSKFSGRHKCSHGFSAILMALSLSHRSGTWLKV
jgi:hypothetical protein